MSRTQTSAFGIVVERVWLLVLGAAALALLIRLHGLELQHSEKEEKKVHLTAGAVAAFVPSDTPESKMLSAAVRKVKGTEFDDRDALYAAIDREVTVPAAAATLSDTRADARAHELARLVNTSKTLGKEEEQIIGALQKSSQEAVNKGLPSGRPPDEERLRQLLIWRERLSRLYLSRAEAVQTYEDFVRGRVRQEFNVIAPIALKPKEVAHDGLLAKLGDHQHPMHVLFDLLWYASLITAVLSLSSFIVGGILGVFGVPGVTGAFGEKAKKLFEAGAEGSRAGALASMGAVALLGVGTVATSVASTESSPWKHTHWLSADIAGHETEARQDTKHGSAETMGLKGPVGDKGAIGDRGTAGESGEVVHRVQVDPITVTPQQVVVNPTPVTVNPAPVNVYPTVPVPEGWTAEFVRMKNRVDGIDGRIAEKMDSPLELMGKKVDDTDTAREKYETADVESSAVRDVRSAWAALPWFRQFQVGPYQLLLADAKSSGILESDREVVKKALAKMLSPKPRLYHEFVAEFSRNVRAVADAGMNSGDIDRLLRANLKTVLGICRVAR
jgi:hypothetical protein